MKRIEFEMQGDILCVRVEGFLLYKPRLNVKVTKQAVKAKAISPQMKTNMFNNIIRELRDNGFKPEEVKVVTKRFEEEFVV